jgi:cytochrome c peroxidase
MNAGSKTKLMRKLSEAPYKQLLEHVFGNKIFTDSNYAFECIKSAIARYEESSELSPFSSKFDYYLAGKVSLTDKEKWGLELFNDPKKGNCAACHPSTHDAISGKVLFTDFTYDNIGLPAHPNSIQNRDVGQGTHLGKSENGKYKVPTLRNVALTAPYFHNGVINNLHDAVEFYNSRNSGKFGKPEIEENMNTDELSELGLTAEEVDAIVAFLHTLTDGYEANKNADATQFIRISKR